jgi:Na+/H+ antiporter NhaD/arsenite permease-like protein
VIDGTVLAIFAAVYSGMVLGEIPGLALDRSGIALLGAIALVAVGRTTPELAWRAIDVPTIALLFGLMVVSAQFRLGGFYTEVVRRIGARSPSPPALLGMVIGASGILSAVLANDIVCLAMTPVLIATCVPQRLNPIPFLLALAAAANVGSAMTLIGNPQNMLIGQTLRVPFAWYLREAFVPSIAGLAATWLILNAQWRGRWGPDPKDRAAPPIDGTPGESLRAFDSWQSAKGLVVITAVVVAFLFAPWPREVVALTAAGVLLLSRHLTSYEMLGLVDWHLIVLFAGLFVLHDATARAGLLDAGFAQLRNAGVDVSHVGWMFALTPVLSNVVSNVPAVMLLLPAADGPLAALTLALASTLAGNLLIVGSIANIIVVDQAARRGVRIDWRTHARSGVPITVATLAIAGVWLFLRASA